MRSWAVSLVAVLFATAASAGPRAPPEVPDPLLTPGAARTDLTVEQICSTKWGKDARHVNAATKLAVFHAYGFTGNKDRACKGKRHWEIDHLISREVGGADDIKNLWSQCYSGKWNAVMKDKLENRLHRELCAGNMTLSEVQQSLVPDWRDAYRRFYGGPR